MADEDLLDGTVEEAKEELRNKEDPDYSEYLEKERNNKNRKTLTSWLESRVEENDNSETEEEIEEELEEIEENTSSSMFSSTPKEAVGIAGVLLGVVIGLTTGLGATQITGQVGMADPSVVQSDVQSVLESDRVSNLQVDEPVTQNGMYFVNATGTITRGNTTRTVTQGYYVSPDGNLLFPRRNSPLRNVPINIQEQLSQDQEEPSETPNQNENQTAN